MRDENRQQWETPVMTEYGSLEELTGDVPTTPSDPPQIS